MGAKQSLADEVQHQDGTCVKGCDDDWTICQTACDLLTVESWTLLDGNLVASFDVNDDFMIIPSAEELSGWIRKLRRARHYCVFREAPEHIKNSRDAVYAAVCGDANALDFAPEIYQRDRDIVMAAVKRECQVFENLSEEFRADREVALLAIRSNGSLLRHTAKALHRDRQVVNAAIKTDSAALLLYPQECWDVDLVLAALGAIPNKQGYTFRSFMDNVKIKDVFDQRHFVLAAVEKDPLMLQFASRNLKADKELVLHAVKRCWKALEYASCEVRSDEDVVAAALAQNPLALQFAADNIKNDYNLVLEIVKKDPQALMFASKKLRADDVVSATAYAAYISQKCKGLA